MEVQPATEPIYAPKSSLSKNKKLIIAVTVVLAIILAVVILLFSSGNPVANNNPSDGSGMQTPNFNEDTQGFSTLPENTCPSSLYLDSGVLRGDYNGKPYLIVNEDWVRDNCSNLTSGVDGSSNNSQGSTEDEPPLLLKSIGFNLEAYNASTQTAGDIKFTNIDLPFDQLYSPYGQQDPRPGNSGMINPQPTVILPLGTDVEAIVDGKVVEVKELYSGDWTVWIAKSETSPWFYEMEHVMNPTVQKGDTVQAGDVIGEVSDYDTKNHPGFGLVEIGILHSKSGGAPEHVCPYNYLDSSIKNTVNSNLTKLYDAWEEFIGMNVYDQENFASPGCVTLDIAQG
jgi:hypothetical protein